MEKVLKGKKIAIVIAIKDFKDEEYFTPKGILESLGAEIKTFSNSLGLAIGSEGGEARIDNSIENISVDEFDALLFIGGQGALAGLDNEASYRLINSFFSSDKLIGAICIAPVILANAGVLKGKKATVWSSLLDKGPIKTIEEKGATYEDLDVVTDGNIITAKGSAARDFGWSVVKSLTK